MMAGINTKRRNLLSAAALLPFAPLAHALAPTPPAMEGPFYPTSSIRFDDVDNDLVKIEGAVKAAGGEVIQLNGRLVDSDGDAIANATVEIWQCDAPGVTCTALIVAVSRVMMAFRGLAALRLILTDALISEPSSRCPTRAARRIFM
jgi:hypothetical protein